MTIYTWQVHDFFKISKDFYGLVYKVTEMEAHAITLQYTKSDPEFSPTTFPVCSEHSTELTHTPVDFEDLSSKMKTRLEGAKFLLIQLAGE